MRSIGRVECSFNLTFSVELSCKIGNEMSLEFIFGCGEKCTVVLVEAGKASTEFILASSIYTMQTLSSEKSVVKQLTYSFGQLHSGSHINRGPVNHLDLLLISDRGIPRVLSSARFRGPGQCFH